MIRELILTSGDLSASPWFRRCEPPPIPPMPEGIRVEILKDPARAGLFAIGPVTPDEAERRLGEGDSCITVLDANGLAAEMWCSEATRFIEWIGCKIRPPSGHTHLFNAWVRPELRGLGLQWIMAATSCEVTLARGSDKIFAGVERKEYAPFARKYAAMGLGLVAPYKSIWAARAFGLTFRVSTRTPRCLDPASRKAHATIARAMRRA